MSRRLVSSLLPPVLPSKAVLGCMITALCCTLGTMLHGEESVATAISKEVQCLFERARHAVVKIEGADSSGSFCGTGFFIDPSGIVLTSYSVGGESNQLIVTQGDLKLPARRLISDCRSGIAILQIEKNTKPTPFLPLAKQADLSVASPAVIISHPLDHPLSPSFGFVAGLELRHRNRYFATTHIRANIPVQRGEGGAPLLNMKGEAVGIVISGIENGCLVLPIEAASKIYHDYVRYGVLRPGWLGIIVSNAQQAAPIDSFAMVAGLEDCGPALQAGLRVGDLLVKIGNHKIISPEDVVNASFFLTSGEPIAITVWRPGDEETVLEITPSERPTPVGPRPTKSAGIPFGSEDITARHLESGD